VLLYLPNLVINLCFLVHLDAELEEIDKLARKAPHEHEFIHEATRGESFTRQDICSFISTTRQPDVAGQYLYANTWCEGSLVPFYFALLDIES
jgi:hypothetical protein